MTLNRPSGIRARVTLASGMLIMGACLFTCTQMNQEPSKSPEKITIAYSTSPHALLAQVAQIKGYYLREGLDVIPQTYSYGKVALDAVLEGKADFATAAETPVMLAILKGEKIAIIATIQTSNKNNAIVARKDKGIHSPGDLKGRRIAATFGTISEFFMDAFLATHGMSRKDMKVVSLAPEALQAALINGEVDAVSTWHPFLIHLEKQLGGKGITLYDEDIYTQTFNIVATQTFIRKNPGKVRKMLLALIRAEEFVRENPAESQKIVADFVREDISLMREIWSGHTFSVGLDQALVLALEDESRWAIHDGLTGAKKVPNYLDFIYVEGLKSVKPEAVRILR